MVPLSVGRSVAWWSFKNRQVPWEKTNQQIAEELVVSVNTVIRHVSNIFSKTGASNRTEAAAYATRHGIAL